MQIRSFTPPQLIPQNYNRINNKSAQQPSFSSLKGAGTGAALLAALVYPAAAEAPKALIQQAPKICESYAASQAGIAMAEASKTNPTLLLDNRLYMQTLADLYKYYRNECIKSI